MAAKAETLEALREHDRYLAGQIAHCERKITYWQRRLTMLKAGQEAQHRFAVRLGTMTDKNASGKGPAE